MGRGSSPAQSGTQRTGSRDLLDEATRRGRPLSRLTGMKRLQTGAAGTTRQVYNPTWAALRLSILC
jgi:hypothetical protein